MARTRGALNKRTRAGLQSVKTGDLLGKGTTPIEFMLKVMRDSAKPDELRLEAAKSLAPYIYPKLSSVENINLSPDDMATEAELNARLHAMLNADPSLLQRITELAKEDATVESASLGEAASLH